MSHLTREIIGLLKAYKPIFIYRNFLTHDINNNVMKYLCHDAFPSSQCKSCDFSECKFMISLRRVFPMGSYFVPRFSSEVSLNTIQVVL